MIEEPTSEDFVDQEAEREAFREKLKAWRKEGVPVHLPGSFKAVPKSPSS